MTAETGQRNQRSPVCPYWFTGTDEAAQQHNTPGGQRDKYWQPILWGWKPALHSRDRQEFNDRAVPYHVMLHSTCPPAGGCRFQDLYDTRSG